MDDESDCPEAITAVFLLDVLSAAWRLATLPTESIRSCIPLLTRAWREQLLHSTATELTEIRKRSRSSEAMFANDALGPRARHRRDHGSDVVFQGVRNTVLFAAQS